MEITSYSARRSEVAGYFDRTALDAWEKLTSDAPVSRIRATVREGRGQMRNKILSWLPSDLSGASVLDAGCGTGAFAIALAERGAQVMAVDISPKLIDIAIDRTPEHLAGRIHYCVGDMLQPRSRTFNWVIGMDCLIHYQPNDIVWALAQWAERCDTGVVFTFAPGTPLLSTFHMVGKIFPRGNRAPAIHPVAENRLRDLVTTEPGLEQWVCGRTQRVVSGFYISQALELARD